LPQQLCSGLSQTLCADSLICFNDTPPTGVTLPVVTGASSRSALDSANPLLTDSYYVNNTHFGMAAVMFEPVKRVTTQAGYSITRVDGSRRSSMRCNPMARCDTAIISHWHKCHWIKVTISAGMRAGTTLNTASEWSRGLPLRATFTQTTPLCPSITPSNSPLLNFGAAGCCPIFVNPSYRDRQPKRL